MADCDFIDLGIRRDNSDNNKGGVMNTKLLTYSDLESRYNRNYKTIWTWVKQGKFPKPIKLNGRTLGWKQEEVEQFESTH